MHEVEAVPDADDTDRDVVTLGARERTTTIPEFDALFRAEFPRVAQPGRSRRATRGPPSVAPA